MTRPLVADINLHALRHNFALIQALNPSGSTLAVLKADAYGHGALPAAQALADLAPAFAVASLEEAQALRQQGVNHPILLLEGFFSADELPIIAEQGYWLMIHSQWQIEALTAYQAQIQQPTTWTLWIKVDSGMHRLGFAPESLPDVLAQLQPLATQEILLASHCARADELDHPLTQQQINCMQELEHQTGLPVSLANSAASLAWPAARFAWQRPGIALYGMSPFTGPQPEADQLQPVMTLRSALIAIQDYPAGSQIGYGGRGVLPEGGRVGVVACGYGDGYPRQAVEGTPVLVNGQRCPLIGRVSMDMLMVNLSHLPQAQVGDEVELWGARLPAQEVARYCDTISYTLLTGLLPRVPRRYSE